MQLEQRMEQTEALIETNEENKRRLSAAHAQYSRAEERARVAQAQAQRCQNQLQQAVAAEDYESAAEYRDLINELKKLCENAASEQSGSEDA